jgi:septum formation protein
VEAAAVVEAAAFAAIGAESLVEYNARLKADAVADRHPADWVLGADTVVVLDERIFGKPRDLDEAKEFLRELSGRTHKVFTAVAFDGKVEVVVSEVKFRDLTRTDIEEYVAKVKPVDRAGAYDIDESGSLIVESYGGSYENIMGLPIEPLVKWGIA